MATNREHTEQPPFRRTRSGIVLLGFPAIAAFFLLTEHRAYLLGALPFVLLALCPLLHFFGHGGQGGVPIRGAGLIQKVYPVGTYLTTGEQSPQHKEQNDETVNM
ncbi:MAG: DUF2933 domain-containing protein [Sulfuricaulis sp.]